jgi:hypothetical protein
MELAWRHAAGQAGYAGGFVQHYLFDVLYPPGLTRPGQAAIGIALVALTTVAYLGAWLRWRRACGAPTRS